GILSYVVAVRSLHARVGSLVSLRLSAPTAVRLSTAAVQLVTVTSGTAPAALSTRDNALRSTLPDGDVYRIKVSTSSGGVEAALQSEVYWIPHGSSREIPVFLRPRPGHSMSRPSTVTVTVQADSDNSVVASTSFSVRER